MTNVLSQARFQKLGEAYQKLQRILAIGRCYRESESEDSRSEDDGDRDDFYDAEDDEEDDEQPRDRSHFGRNSPFGQNGSFGDAEMTPEDIMEM